MSAGQNGGHSRDVNHQKRKNVISMEPKQLHVLKLSHIKSLELDEIDMGLSNAYNRDVFAPPSIKHWPHQIKLGRTGLQIQHVGGRPLRDDIDAEIISVLRKFPFSSVRTIDDSLNILVSTVILIWWKKLILNFFFVGFLTY
jgi:hypothetical protein